MINKRNNKSIQVIILAAIILLIVVLGVDISQNFINKSNTNNSSSSKTNVNSTNVTLNDADIADAVSKLYDSTVIVELGSGDDIEGWGSGFVYKTDDKYAYIITNYHVTEGKKKVNIVYTDQSETTGSVIGGDEYTDVSVIRVDKNTIKGIATLGSSSKTKVGDTVFAIGTPVSLNFSFTVTRGILSGKDRLVSMSSSNSQTNIFGFPIQGESWYINLLQIDASINSGNSGGPLANALGEVIGITNSKLSSSYSETSIENIGFAVPIEDVINVAEQVIKTGVVIRPYLGLEMTNPSAASKYNVKINSDTKGALVVKVELGSSADKAGLKSGDIITKFGDYDITNFQYLKYYLYRYNVGDTVTITYERDGKSQTTQLTLVEK